MSTRGDDNTTIPSLLPALQAKGLGAAMDRIIEEIVFEHQDDIHHIINAILAKKTRESGKGHKASQAPTSASGPAYTLRDAKIKPSKTDVKKTGAYVHRVTRSTIQQQSTRVPTANTILALFNAARSECAAVVAEIVTACKSRDVKYFDDSFYFDSRDNLYPAGSPADCTVAEPKGTARLRDLYPRGKLISNAVTVDDVVQGDVGDCFFIGSLAALAANDPQDVRDLFAACDENVGVYGVVFYKQGAWEWVIVDDFVATKSERSGAVFPLFASSSSVGDDVEYWPMIVEKAYAKLHWNWDCIDGGWAKEALADMTGGVEYVFDFRKRNANMTFQQFLAEVEDPHTILCCSLGSHIAQAAATGNAGEQGAAFGLFHGHQYSVNIAKQTSDGTCFVQVRNPWGGDAEWTGRYGDKSTDWMKNPSHKKELGMEAKDDGIFWMLWEDFRNYFSNVEIVRNFPDHYTALNLYSQALEVPTPNSTFVVRNPSPKSMTVTFVVEQDDPKVVYDSTQHGHQKNDAYLQLSLSVGQLAKEPRNEDEAANATNVAKVPSTRARNIHMTLEVVPGISVALIKVTGGDPNKAQDFCFRCITEATMIQVYRLSDGPTGMITATPPASTAVSSPLRGAMVVAPQQGPLTVASPVVPTTTAPAVKQVSQRDMDEAKAYIAKLEALVQQQQRQLDEASKRPAPRRPLERLGMDQAAFDTLARQVFTEMARGKPSISQAQALNGLRLIATLGAGLDDQFQEACTASGVAAGSNLSLIQFSQLCSRAINAWPTLAS